MTSTPPPDPPGIQIPQGPTPKKQERLKWFAIGCGSAILLIVVFLAVVTIPNFVNAVQRGKQKMTMTGIRSIAEAIEAHAIKHNRYPDARSMSELSSVLDPSPTATLPMKDGWERDFRLQLSTEDYRIGSAGRDGLWEHDTLEAYGLVGSTTTFNSDIIYQNGAFIQWPDGGQR